MISSSDTFTLSVPVNIRNCLLCFFYRLCFSVVVEIVYVNESCWERTRTTTASNLVINCLASLIFLGQKIDLVNTWVLCDFPANSVFCGMSLFSSKFVQGITSWITIWFTQNQLLDHFGACSFCWTLPIHMPGLSAAAPWGDALAGGGWAGMPRAGCFHKVIHSDRFCVLGGLGWA